MLTKSTLLMSLAALALACGPAKPTDNTPPPTTGGDEQAPEFQGGGQQGNVGESLYPGPYGVGVGSVIPNYHFFGYPRPIKDGATSVNPADFQKIQLADFYNPTGTEVYPPGSPYGEGTPKPLALVVARSAVWCGPCQKEAKEDFPEQRALHTPKVEFFVSLDDGATGGTPATQAELNGWVNAFQVNYPAVIDPNGTFGAIVGQAAYPGNVLIRTKDMKIVTWTTGVSPSSPLWQKMQAVVNGEPVLPGDI